jgi:hypothetical protein
MTKSKNVLSNKLTDAINNSMSINRGEKVTTFAGINKISSNVTSPI